jgi:hypothetical protein
MATVTSAADDASATPATSWALVSEQETLSLSSSVLALDLVRETCERFMRRRRTDRSGVSRLYRPSFVREMNARQLCLCLSLRALGFLVEIPDGVIGPLWAVADGMRLLAPLGARIYHVDLDDAPMTLRAGAYVLWLMGHFMPMRLIHADSVEFPASARLFRVVTGPAVELFDSTMELAEVVSEGRRRLRERLGREAGLILYLELGDFPVTAWIRSVIFSRLLRAEAPLIARDRQLRSLLRDVRGAGVHYVAAERGAPPLRELYLSGFGGEAFVVDRGIDPP